MGKGVPHMGEMHSQNELIREIFTEGQFDVANPSGDVVRFPPLFLIEEGKASTVASRIAHRSNLLQLAVRKQA